MNMLKPIYSLGILSVLMLAIAAVATSCGGKKTYKIEGTVEGLGTRNITALYFDGSSFREIQSNAVNSRFTIEGSAEAPVIIEFYDKERNRLGCLVAQNGDDIKVKFKVNDPCFMEVTGNELSTSLATFLTGNRKNLNEAIERRLASTPNDDLSAILAAYYYDISASPARADSLLANVSAVTPSFNALLDSRRMVASRLGAAPAKVSEMKLFYSADTLVTYAPASATNTLFIFTDLHSMPDSILAYADSLARDIRVATIRLNTDTFGWHRDAARFSKKVDHLWAVGGVANPQLKQFDIPRVPYFVVTDSAGNQIYRGHRLPRNSK